MLKKLNQEDLQIIREVSNDVYDQFIASAGFRNNLPSNSVSLNFRSHQSKHLSKLRSNYLYVSILFDLHNNKILLQVEAENKFDSILMDFTDIKQMFYFYYTQIEHTCRTLNSLKEKTIGMVENKLRKIDDFKEALNSLEKLERRNNFGDKNMFDDFDNFSFFE